MRLSKKESDIVLLILLVVCCLIFIFGFFAVREYFIGYATLPSGNQWYASPSGSASGDGSISRPWDLQTALNQPAAVKAGDTIWLRGGTYTHFPQGVVSGNAGWIFYSKLVGTASNPILVRGYPGERATIDGGAYKGIINGIDYGYQANGRPTLAVWGAYTWFMDLEIMSSSTEARFSPDDSSFPASITRSDGPNVYAVGIKFINLVIHDLTAGISAWGAASNFEAYGNIGYNNGWQGTPNAHGHNIYTQNYASSVPGKIFMHNILINPYQKNLQAYGSGQSEITHYRIHDNTFINSPSIVGGRNTAVLQDNQLINNYFYNDGFSLYYPSNAGTGPTNYNDITATGNYVVDGTFEMSDYWKQATIQNNVFINTHSGVRLTSPTDGMLVSFLQYNNSNNYPVYAWSNNIYYSGPNLVTDPMFVVQGVAASNIASWKTLTRYDSGSVMNSGLPTTNKIIVQPNQYDTNRANIIIYNWQLQSTVNVDTSLLGWNVGDNYELRNVADYYGDVLRGTYTGSPLSFNMQATSHSVALPYGSSITVGPNTFPAFGAFVLIRTTGTPVSDTTPPSVSITTPNSGALLSGIVQVSAIASDNVGVLGVQFKVDGVNLGLEDTSAPYSVSWTTSQFSLGAHTLTAVARDTAGNSASGSIAVSIVSPIVNTPPLVNAGLDKIITLPSIASLQGIASDDGLPSNILTTSWSKVSGPGTVTFVQPNALTTNVSFSTSGTYVLRLTANDGSLVSFDDILITVNPAPALDTTPPTRLSGAPSGILAAGTTSTVLSLSTNENATCKYSSTPGGSYASLSSVFGGAGTQSHKITLVGLVNNNAYSYYVRCQDLAGNVNPDDYLINFSLGNQAPTVLLTSPTSGSSFVEPATFMLTATASDSDGSISRVDFYNGNISLGSDSSFPYNFIWNNVSAGVYILSARATDDRNVVATSPNAVVIISSATQTLLSCGGTLPPQGVLAGPSLYNSGYPSTNWTYGQYANLTTPCLWRCDFNKDYVKIGSFCTYHKPRLNPNDLSVVTSTSSIVSVIDKITNETLMAFNNVQAAQVNLTNVQVVRSDLNETQSYLIVSNLTLPSGAKILYMPQQNPASNSVCLADIPNLTSKDEILTSCQLVSCPGSLGGYTCDLQNGVFSVYGLHNSGIIEQVASNTPPSGGGGSGSSGGGGGGGGGSSGTPSQQGRSAVASSSIGTPSQQPLKTEPETQSAPLLTPETAKSASNVLLIIALALFIGIGVIVYLIIVVHKRRQMEQQMQQSFSSFSSS